MKLPNYIKNNMFTRIRSKLNIPKEYVTELECDLNHVSLNLKQANFTQLERGRGIDIDLNQLEVGIDNSLVYENKNVILYIRYQYSYKSEYKYHISWCKTLKEMRSNHKLNRYVVSRRTDGTFFVNMFDSSTHKLISENEVRRLGVCKNCLSEINYNEYSYSNYQNKNNIYLNFSINEFLQKYDTKFNQLPKYTENNAPINQYPDNWNEISSKFRENKQWKCEECGRDCSDNTWELDVHHLDSNKYNADYLNLRALCKRCHGNQPGHGRYKNISRYI